MTTTEGRLTPEREAEIREGRAPLGDRPTEELLRELDAVRRERDEARKITDAMIERVARIIYNETRPPFTVPANTWEYAMPSERESFRSLAKRVLDAVGEGP